MAGWIVSAVSAGWILSYRFIAISLDIAGAGSYCLDWLDWIGWIGLDNNGWMRTHSYCKDGTDGTDGNDGNDGLDEALLRLGWDRRLLAPAGTRVTEQERHHWLAGYCKKGTNGTNGIDGALMGQGWDGRKLSGAGTGAPPWAPEQERHRWLLRGSVL